MDPPNGLTACFPDTSPRFLRAEGELAGIDELSIERMLLESEAITSWVDFLLARLSLAIPVTKFSATPLPLDAPFPFPLPAPFPSPSMVTVF